MTKQIEITLSKKKIILVLIGALFFVVFGVLGTLNPESFVSHRYHSPLFIRITSIIGVIFFGICLKNIIQKLFDNNNIGLTINEDGIIENTNNFTVGLINWEDITGFKTIKIRSTKIIFVNTNKPEKYIARAQNRVHKSSLKSNNMTAGTPICINPQALSIKSEKLEELLITQFENRKKKTTTA